jgi:CRISPR-associated endonuclease/helicase Cas3
VEDARFEGIDLVPYGQFDKATGTPYSLLFTMLDNAAMAGQVWDRLLTPGQRVVVAKGMGLTSKQARAVVALLAGLQPVGMMVPECQRREPRVWTRLSPQLTGEAPRGGPPPAPARMSMHLAVGLLAGFGYRLAGNASPAVRAAQVVGSQDGVFLQVDVAGAASPARVDLVAGGGLWQELRFRYARLVRHLAGATAVPCRFTVPAAVLAAGVVQLTSRLAARRAVWEDGAHMPAFGAGEHFMRAEELCAQQITEGQWQRVDLDEVPFAVAHRQAVTPNAMQRSVMEDLPGLVDRYGGGFLVVRDVTGGGKSICGLEAARIFNQRLGTRGVLWLMPTTATADAAWETLVAYVRAHEPDEPVPVTLAHHLSMLNAAYTARLLLPRPDRSPAAGPRRPGGTPAPDAVGSGSATDAPDDDRVGELAPADGQTRGEWQAEAAAGDVTAPGAFSGSAGTALLAQFCAATIDQALMAVLPVDSSALRLLAVSGKTVVIDEVHAPEPFSQAQLLRLLTWLGALRTPVVVLSATLSDAACDQLARAYLDGRRSAGEQLPLPAGDSGTPFAEGAPETAAAAGSRALYPGWQFVDAAGGVHRMNASDALAHAAAHQRRAQLRLHPVARRRLGENERREVGAGERLAVIADLLRPVAGLGGCAAVTCATVSDAQDTYRHLRTVFPGLGDQLVLLHARFPGVVRAARIAALRAALARSGRRPNRLVVVTTSLLDTSMDIDFDLMISDLASLALLLQRLGRLARFDLSMAPGGRDGVARPPWWTAGSPAPFHVLQPVSAHGATAIPASWRTVEPAVLRQATAALLASRDSDLLRLPGDVQDLVEAVHGEGAPFTRPDSPLSAPAAALHHRQVSETHLSGLQLVPPAARVSSLADLHRQHLTTAQAVTRLGVPPMRLLPCYLHRDGRRTLDRAGQMLLPDGERLRAGDVHRILEHALPVPAAWAAARTEAHQAPASWRHRLLRDMVLLPAPAGDPRHVEQFGRYGLRMDDDLGLVTTRTTPAPAPGQNAPATSDAINATMHDM